MSTRCATPVTPIAEWGFTPNPDLEGAFAAIQQGHADALLVLEEPVLGVYATRIAELAAKDRLPAMFAPS